MNTKVDSDKGRTNEIGALANKIAWMAIKHGMSTGKLDESLASHRANLENLIPNMTQMDIDSAMDSFDTAICSCAQTDQGTPLRFRMIDIAYLKIIRDATVKESKTKANKTTSNHIAAGLVVDLINFDNAFFAAKMSPDDKESASTALASALANIFNVLDERIYWFQ